MTALGLRQAIGKRGVLDTLLTTVTGLGSQVAVLVSGIVVARVLGVEARGHFAQIFLVSLILTYLGSLGVPLALTYYIASDRRHTSALVAKVTPVLLIQVVAVLAVHAALLLIFFGHASADVRTAAAITLATTSAALVQQYGLAVLQGLQLFAPFNVLRLTPAALYAAGAVFVLVSGRHDITTMAVVYTAATVAAAAMTAGYAWRVIRRRSPVAVGADSTPTVKDLVRFGSKGLLGSASPLETFRLDQAVVGLFLAPVALGLYVSAAAFTNLPKFVAQSIGMVAYPKIAAEPDERRRRAVMTRFTLLGWGVCAALVAVLILAVPTLLPFFLGEEFEGAVGVARVLLVGGLFIGMRRVLSDGARGIGRPGAGTMAEAVSWVVLIPGLAFALQFGILGVAWALTASAATSVAALVVMLHLPVRRSRRAGMGEGLTFRLAVQLAVAVVAATLVGAGAANFPDSGVLSLTGLVALCALVIALAPIAHRVITGTFDLFEPVVGAGLMLAVLFGVRPLSMLVRDDLTLHYRPTIDVSVSFDRAVVLGALATGAFVAGYELLAHPRRRGAGVRGSPPEPRGRPSLVLHPRAVADYGILISVVGLALFAIFVRQAGGLGVLTEGRTAQLGQIYGSSSEYLSAGPIALACAAMLYLLARGGRLRTAAERVSIAALTIVPVALFALTGVRRFIIPCLLLPFIVHYLARGRRPPRRALFVLLPLAFLVFATIPYARASGARVQAGGVLPIFTAAFSAPFTAVDRFMTGYDTDMVPDLALQMRYQEATGKYWFGRATLGDLALSPVPSQLVAKPITARNELLTGTFGTSCATVAGGKCPDFSVVGTFFQDFGYPGALFGMFFLGLGASGIWARFRRRPDDPRAVLLASVSAIFLPIMIRAGFLPPMAWVLYFVVPTWAGITIASRRAAWTAQPASSSLPSRSSPGRGLLPRPALPGRLTDA